MRAKSGPKPPPDTELRTAPLGLRLKPSMKAELQDLADADRRKLATYVELVLEEHVAAKKAAQGRK